MINDMPYLKCELLEDRGADASDVKTSSIDAAKECDIYIGIFGKEYSEITIEECRTALDNNKRFLNYVQQTKNRNAQLEEFIEKELKRRAKFHRFNKCSVLEEQIKKDLERQMAKILRAGLSALSQTKREAEVIQNDVRKQVRETAPEESRKDLINLAQTDYSRGNYLSSLITAFTFLETTLRNRLSRISGKELRAVPLHKLIANAADLKLLDQDTMIQLRIVQDIRNIAIHGGFIPSKEDVKRILSVAEHIDGLMQSVTLQTNKLFFASGDEVIVTGWVPAVIEGVPVVIQVFNSVNELYMIGQVLPNVDGKFDFSFKIKGKLAVSGTYTVKVNYAGKLMQTTFGFGKPMQAIKRLIKVRFDGKTYDVKTELSNGTIKSIEVDPDYTSIVFFVVTGETQDGILKVVLPRNLIDAKMGEKDDVFIILIDGEESDYEETRIDSMNRTLSIPIPAGAQEIEIIGTQLGTLEILPEVVFDKDSYTPFDKMIISIIAPSFNKDPNSRDKISVQISSSRDSIAVEFLETGSNTGIFEKEIRLTPNKPKFRGDLEVKRDDQVQILLRVGRRTIATKSASMNYHVGQVMFDKDGYAPKERAVVRVIDPDENRNPDEEDIISVDVSSTTDRKGLKLELRETGARTGIFEGILSFTTDQESSGTTLRVSDGDTITAKYIDKTLPPPAKFDVNTFETSDVEELFASALIGTIIPPMERAVMSDPVLVDRSGTPVKRVSVGQSIIVQTEINNIQNKKQPFAYVMQIKDRFGVITELSRTVGELTEKGSLVVAQSWTPTTVGKFIIELFLWESIEVPIALSPPREAAVTVEK